MLRSQSGSPTAGSSGSSALDDRRPVWSLGEGAGARRLAEVKVRAAIQLVVVQVRPLFVLALSHAFHGCFLGLVFTLLHADAVCSPFFANVAFE